MDLLNTVPLILTVEAKDIDGTQIVTVRLGQIPLGRYQAGTGRREVALSDASASIAAALAPLIDGAMLETGHRPYSGV